MEKYRFNDTERKVLESSRIPLAVYQFINRKVTTLVLSDGFCELFGYDDRAAACYDMDNDMYKNVHPDDSARIENTALRFAEDSDGKARYEAIYRSLKKDSSEYIIIHASGEHIITADGDRLAYVWYTNEGSYSTDSSSEASGLTTALKKALFEESLFKENRYDVLTGLPGMTYFFDIVNSRNDEMLKEGKHPALLFMDLCRMKDFNQRKGFAEGDKLLQAFARLLARYFGNENCSRLGEDHFTAITDSTDINGRLENLFEECRWINGGLSLPVHVGIYLYDPKEQGAATMCDRAKLACDSLLNTYSSASCYYDASMQENEEKRQHIIANIDRAVSEGWITVYYQPIVRAVNGKVCDEEALARWIDPIMGFMSPADFIPTLEDCGLIYKLDLCVLDLVLKKLKKQKAAGLHLVPQSINLSRSDFEACDIVEEICRRVDASGLDRKLITIEITESIVGGNFDFMKDRIERFRELGFLVWMDDFGSGYSSPDILQNIKFDLLKFDMNFLRNFNSNDSVKIILTQLMKMATFLGIDTVCEGVETAEQVQFMREIGCSKLQGYYYAKPMPLEAILERYEKGIQIGFEDPAQSEYYETIGRVNLHDLAVITQDSGKMFNNFFNMLPMAVVELHDDKIRIARSNRSYRDFVERYFDMQINDINSEHALGSSQVELPSLVEVIKQCCKDNRRAFADSRLKDNSAVHFFVRSIAENPVSQTIAAVVVVLSVTDAKQGADYVNIARALAADYTNLYYVDIESEYFIEYSSGVGKQELAVERHGKNFFHESRKDALEYLYEEDRAAFIDAFRKDKLLSSLDEQGTFTLTYRLLQNGVPVYVNMKAMRMQDNDKYIIIGVSNVDTQMRQKELLMKAERDRTVYTRIMALSGDYICMYTVDPESGRYREYSAAGVYEGFGFEKSGSDFFASAQTDGERSLKPEDYPRYRELFTKENVLREIDRNGVFSMEYRLMIDGKPQRVCLKAVLVHESDGSKLIVGVSLTEKAET